MAEKPDEIAVAVIAEIILEKNKKKFDCAYPLEILEVAENPEYANDSMILATIISRGGTFPREAGSKMLVLPNGECIGTIGGGVVEESVRRKAVQMIEEDCLKNQLCYLNTTGDKEEDGMLCGGEAEVLLEMI